MEREQKWMNVYTRFFIKIMLRRPVIIERASHTTRSESLQIMLVLLRPMSAGRKY